MKKRIIRRHLALPNIKDSKTVWYRYWSEQANKTDGNEME